MQAPVLGKHILSIPLVLLITGCAEIEYDILLYYNIPIAPKKSFPKKGNPGLLASTTILKSGCETILCGVDSSPDDAENV